MLLPLEKLDLRGDGMMGSQAVPELHTYRFPKVLTVEVKRPRLVSFISNLLSVMTFVIPWTGKKLYIDFLT